MTLLNGLHQEVEQSPLVVPVLGVGELGQVGDVKPNGLFIPRTCVHDVAHQQDKFKNFAKFTGPFNLNMPRVAKIYIDFFCYLIPPHKQLWQKLYQVCSLAPVQGNEVGILEISSVEQV